MHNDIETRLKQVFTLLLKIENEYPDFLVELTQTKGGNY